ncbi:MAG: hypothetical protein MPN21_09090 [Thermoanaerobaculia bacterium]|nr:hypothetical protein [Thermoanaerobaculia bacterium]
MKTTTLTVVALAFLAVLALLVFALWRYTQEQDALSEAPSGSPPQSPLSHPAAAGDLYGRVTTRAGTVYEGRLRWGGDEEAMWNHYFNGFKDKNPWADFVSTEQLTEGRQIELFGVEIAREERPLDLGRPFMARFGDITLVEAVDRNVKVTLKSGTVFDLDRFEASDFDDGIRVWDGDRVVDLGSREIRTIELMTTPGPEPAPDPLHGVVLTRQGEFAGLLQWNRQDCLGSDELVGQSAEGEQRLRFDTIRSITRHSRSSALVTGNDGREIELFGTRQAGQGNLGIYVDDVRYGRVLVSWDAFLRVDFGAVSEGSVGEPPGYEDFPSGRPLTGTVTTHGGYRFTGRLVYDLDESETTETLDAPYRGVDYTIPFSLIASIEPTGDTEKGVRFASLALHDGETLRLERAGDLGPGNAGMLIFVEQIKRPEYVPWSDVQRVDFDRPSAIHTH